MPAYSHQFPSNPVWLGGQFGGRELGRLEIATGKLTARQVAAIKTAGRHGDGGGLWLEVSRSGARRWAFRFTLAGRAREMGLGSAEAVTLAEARTAAEKARKLLRAGTDPLDRRLAEAAAQASARQAARARTFRHIAALYVEAHRAGWRNIKHIAQWTSTLATYAHPVLGDIPVSEVGRADVLAVLEPIWRKTPETASRLRGRIEAILDYAAAREWRTGENPARWRGNLAHVLPRRTRVAKVEHHPALPWPEVGAFMATLRAQPGAVALALEFAILTAARTGEVIGARWEEVDLGEAVWTVPGERMKAGREHRVPLSSAALAVLRRAAALVLDRKSTSSSHVFPGRKAGTGLSNMALLALLRRMKRSDLTAHGFRSTFRDWCAEATAYPREVAEAALAHTLRDKVEATYRRGDLFEKRRHLMAKWAVFCNRPPGEQAKVVAIRAVDASA